MLWVRMIVSERLAELHDIPGGAFEAWGPVSDDGVEGTVVREDDGFSGCAKGCTIPRQPTLDAAMRYVELVSGNRGEA